MKNAIKSIAISAGIGLAIGGISLYLVKKHYEDQYRNDVDNLYESYKEKYNFCSSLYTLASHEIFELRKSIALFSEPAICSSILTSVRNVMKSDKNESEYREELEEIISSFSKTNKHSEEGKRRATKLAENLGYSNKPDPDELWNIRMAAVREAAEENMEAPEDDVELSPNGDILDDAYNEENDENNPDAEDGYFEATYPKPYQISEQEFMNPMMDGQYKFNFEYYIHDKILVEDDDVVEDLNDEDRTMVEVVGMPVDEFLKLIKKCEEPSLFIRNDKDMSDFEILIHGEDESYYGI